MPLNHTPLRGAEGSSNQGEIIPNIPPPTPTRGPVPNLMDEELPTFQIDAASATNIKFPPFWQKNPKTWFFQVETIFSLQRITSDETKFRYLVANIDPGTLDLVSDLLESSQTGNRYETLKLRIISLFSESDERKLKRLLSGQVLGDQKPTQLLRTIQNLGQGQVGEKVIRSLFLDQLPDNVRAILAISEQQDVNKLAAQADKILDMTQATSISSLDPVHVSSISSRIEALEKNFENMNRRSRSKTPHRRQSKSRSRQMNAGYCWYHSRFGKKATKCVEPCSYPKN